MDPSDAGHSTSAAPAPSSLAGRARANPAVRALRGLPIRVFFARWGVALGAFTVSLVMTARAHWFFMLPYAVPLSNDEGYITAMALRMTQGHWLPYVDGVSQRGPITYWLCTLAMSVGGLFSWTALRWLSLGLGFGSLTLVFFLGLEILGPFAAAVAVLFQTYFLTYELTAWDGLGYNGELVAMQFVLGSALVVAKVQAREAAADPRSVAARALWSRGGALMAAGALSACACLSKQVTIMHVVPGALWLLLGRDGGGTRGPRFEGLLRRTRDLAAYFVGFAVPFGVVLGIYAGAGHLGEFVYYFQKYGRDIFMAPLTAKLMTKHLGDEVNRYIFAIACVSCVLLLAVARAVRSLLTPLTPASAPASEAGAPGSGLRPGRWAFALDRVRANAGPLFLLVQLAAATAGASFTWRFFGHYFVQFYPFAGLVAGYALSEPFERMDEDHPGTVASGLVFVLGAVAMFFIGDVMLRRNIRLLRVTERWYQDPQKDAIVKYVREKTSPTDTIFVWGFRAETYVSSHRYPASRFIYTVYPAGVVPWFEATREEEETRVVPGSRELLMTELEESKPELIIDAGHSLHGRYMYEIPDLRTYLDKRYCFARYVDGEPVYRRRHGISCPEPDYEK